MSEYIQNLNPTQRDAAVNYQGASLIIAGAGSGKTRVLTCRIAYMLSQGVQAHTVLALTFTNKAAKEMRERIATLVPGGMSRSLWMGTFHSVFARILRAESDKLGYPSSFTIYDSADAKNLVKLAIKELNLSDETYKPNVVAARISKAKNNLVTPQAYEANSSLQAEDREQRIPQFLDIYKLYARKCRENGAMDFDDLLLNTNILMRDFPEVLTKYQNQFRYILVDEYQDTNFAQYVIIRRLGELHGNVCVVGDDAQSIYSFRGAKIENPALPAGLSRRKAFQTGTELPFDTDDRQRRELRDREEPAPDPQKILLGRRRGRPDPCDQGLHRQRGVGAARVGHLHDRPHPRGAVQRRGRTLPHQRAVARAGRGAAQPKHPL